MAILFRLPKVQPLDGNGDPYAGAKAYFYLTGTTTPTDTYQDAALTTAHANPVVADSAGIFAPIYLNPLTVYKLTLKDADDATIYTVDPVQDSLVSPGYQVDDKSSNYTVLSTDRDKLFTFDGAYTATLPAVSGLEGFRVIIENKGSGIVTIDPDGSELVNGQTTIGLGRLSKATLICDGSSWRALVSGHEAGSYTATQTGYAASLTPTVSWRKSGDWVSIVIPSASTDTSNATTMTLTIPSYLTPATTVIVTCLITDNGTQANGLASISGTTITFGATPATTGGFTASGTKGFAAGTVIGYSLA